MLALVRLVAEAGREPEIAALRHRVHGVHHQRKQNLLDLRGVAKDRRQIGIELRLDLNSGEIELVLHQAQGAVDHLVQVGGLQVHRRGAREREEILDQIAAAAAFGGDQIERIADFLAASVACRRGISSRSIHLRSSLA